MRIHFMSVCVLIFSAAVVNAGKPGVVLQIPEKPLAGLKKEHPRLLFTKQVQKAVERSARQSPLLARLIKQNTVNAERMLRESPVRYEIPDGLRLLSQSRKCIERVLAMALAYRLTGQRKFVDGALKDMTIAAGFKDWNPRHFLDTAEMTTALALGYDWLYDELTPEQRRRIREAIVRLGLRSGMKIYRTGGWWAKADSNWNQVCNGGMILGALAVAEDEPELAEQIIRSALKSIPNGLGVYAGSGAYPEGPGYWQYGTTYTVLTMAAFDSALGHDFGLRKAPGLARTGYFRMHTIGPTGLFFNYADCGEHSRPASAMFYLARCYNNPIFAWWHRYWLEQYVPTPVRPKRLDRFFPLEIVWFDQRGRRPSPRQLPRDAFFDSRQDVVTMRSRWADKNAVYVGFKAGDNRSHHGHLDIGSFVFDALGTRWALDLGGDNYNLPGYFSGRQRWHYYRLTNLSHNTLVINGALQNTIARCDIKTFRSTDKRVVAVADLSAAYKSQARSVWRGVELLDRRVLHIRDEIVGAKGEVRWAMVTRASLKLNGAKALLERNGKKVFAVLLSPKGGVFEEVSTAPPTPKENPNKGTRMLAVKVKTDGSKPLVISVLLLPGTERMPTTRPNLQPLAGWGRKVH